MAVQLADLTNVNPYEGQVRAAQQQAQTSSAIYQDVFGKINQGIQLGVQRRADAEARNMQIRDREYALINKETDQLVQPQTNNKYTDLQLQQLGQEFKQDYYAAVKQYEQSDKGDEARQSFEQSKQKALQSARTISGSLDALGAQMDAFRTQYNNGGISDAVNPAIRDFFADLQDPAVASDNFQIVEDPDTGELKYMGQTSNGHEVNFFLDDIANGTNQFTPLPKANMPDVMMNLMNGIDQIKKQEARENGTVVSATDWEKTGVALNGRLESLLTDETNFRSIAAGLGYDYQEFEAAKASEGGLDGLKAEVKQELLDQIESVTPHQEEVLFDPNAQPTQVQQAQQAKQLENQRTINSQVAEAVGKQDLDYFKNELVGRVPGVDDATIKDGKLVLVKGFGKKAQPTSVYDLSKQGDLFRLTELFGGNRDLAKIESSIINF